MRLTQRFSLLRALSARFGSAGTIAVGLVGALTAAHVLFVYAQQPDPGSLVALAASLGALGLLFVVALGFIRLCARRSLERLRGIDGDEPSASFIGRLLAEPIGLALGIQGSALLVGEALRPALAAWTGLPLQIAYTPEMLVMLVAAPLGVALLVGGYSVAPLALRQRRGRSVEESRREAHHAAPPTLTAPSEKGEEAARTGFVGLQAVLVVAMLLGAGSAFQHQIAALDADPSAETELFALQVRGDWAESTATPGPQEDVVPDCRSRSQNDAFTSDLVQRISRFSFPPLVDSLVTLTVSLAVDVPSPCRSAPRAAPETSPSPPSQAPESPPVRSKCRSATQRI